MNKQQNIQLTKCNTNLIIDNGICIFIELHKSPSLVLWLFLCNVILTVNNYDT